MKTIMDYLQRQYVFQCLMGLNESFAHAMGHILLLDQLPPINKVFSLVLQEERQHTISTSFGSSSGSSNHNTTALLTKAASSPPTLYGNGKTNNKNRPICAHCGIAGHTIEKWAIEHALFDLKNKRSLRTIMGSSVITPEDVLESLMNDGTIDAIRLKIINQLKANEELKNNTITMVEQSKVLNTPGAEKQTKRELFDALRLELETPVLEKASKSVWELILDNDGLGKEINETVERVFCRLSGQEPPLFPPNGEAQPEKAKEREKEEENSDSSSKKRSFSEMSMQGGADEVADGSSDPPTILEESVLGGSSLCFNYKDNMEPEPRRCKRTDGRKWRCNKDVVPGQKYCERHMNRGRPCSRKHVEASQLTTATPTASTTPNTDTDLVNSNTNLSVSYPSES
ncbi:hypothetical protein HHK36_012274 [Tetracentron sinense]|uniref:WRC domain-containing protein n=1 Tax=Tetracentron sinense TaxID=13715 RepID=A0A834Z8G4_TETSI|nr:hypothetical protein HHK36_012274 [Tetracentron sinense]